VHGRKRKHETAVKRQKKVRQEGKESVYMREREREREKERGRERERERARERERERE